MVVGVISRRLHGYDRRKDRPLVRRALNPVGAATHIPMSFQVAFDIYVGALLF